MRMKYCFFCLFILLMGWSTKSATAQNQERPQSYGHWFSYSGDHKLNARFGIHSDFSIRNYLLSNSVEQALLRVGLNHYLSKTSMLTAGYAFAFTAPSNENVAGFRVRENRLWQQLVLRHRAYQLFIEHRYRLEQRFLDNLDRGTFNFDNRIRYRFNALLPFYNFSPSLRHYFLAMNNELFMNLGRSVSGQYFDRNRLYMALGYQWSPKFNLQLGYMNQLVSVPTMLAPDVNHLLQLNVSFNMDELGSLFNAQKF
jgi:hypothetical protein